MTNRITRLAAIAALCAAALIGQNYLGVRTGTVAIASSGTVSTALYTGKDIPLALQMPTAFTGTAVTFQGSADGETFQQIYVGGSAYTETVAASKNVVLDGSAFAPFEHIKVVSGSSEGAARTIVVIMRRSR